MAAVCTFASRDSIMDLQALTSAPQAFGNKPMITPANETQDGSGTQDTNDTGGTLATATNQSQEFDTFINLLTAQVRNQDPLAPLDSTQFVEQLATFTNLELQAKSNETLEEILVLLAAQAEAGAPPADISEPADGSV